jgi:hypothetical protein
MSGMIGGLTTRGDMIRTLRRLADQIEQLDGNAEPADTDIWIASISSGPADAAGWEKLAFDIIWCRVAG